MEKRQYEELKEQQDTFWWFAGKREIVTDFAGFFAGLKKGADVKILDVGCGMGLMLERLSQYGTVFGMDTEESAVEYCTTMCTEQGIESNIYQGALPNEVPFEPNSFDFIFALDVIEHVENDCAALSVLNSLLKENGKLILTVPANMSLWSYNDELNHHFRRYDRQELIEKVIRAGFHIIKCSYYNSILYPSVWAVRHIKNAFHIHSSDVNSVSCFNAILRTLFISEKYRLRGKGFKHGVSLILACEKVSPF
jgi:SAM-dependent methyltransferase